MAPFRELLRPSAEFHWDAKLHELFEEVREEVVKKVEAGVKMFEMDSHVSCHKLVEGGCGVLYTAEVL